MLIHIKPDNLINLNSSNLQKRFQIQDRGLNIIEGNKILNEIFLIENKCKWFYCLHSNLIKGDSSFYMLIHLLSFLSNISACCQWDIDVMISGNWTQCKNVKSHISQDH